MIKTKIKKAIAIASLVVISATNFGTSTFAATQIGTGSVVGTSSFDAAITWDDAFPGFATGSVSWIVVSAQVLPSLNMEISTWAIDLGILMPWIESTWSLSIEVGTNAVAWVVITASSWSGGLTNTADGSIQINNNSADWNQENYSFESADWTIDSTVTGFASTGDLAKTEITDSTAQTIYSTNKPEIIDWTNADVTFTVAATANAQTAAGNYEDNITFTISGTF